jgi:hypothetical protein
MYDDLPAERGRELRRLNYERLAELEASGAERRERLERAFTLLRETPPAARLRRADSGA